MISVMVVSSTPIARKTSDARVAIGYDGTLVSTCLTISHLRSRSVNGVPTIHIAKTRGIELMRPEDSAIAIQATKRHAAKTNAFLPGPLSAFKAPRAIAEVEISKRNSAMFFRSNPSGFPVCSRTAFLAPGISF